MKVAILGNGQLAMMLTESVSAYDNVKVDSFDLPQIDALGQSNANEKMRFVEMLRDYDVVTYEIENIDAELLRQVNEIVPVFPSIDALSMSQDRYVEKSTFNALSISTNQWCTVDSYEDLVQASTVLGYPFVVKTRRFGYDGKGQYIIKSEADIAKAWACLPHQMLLAEAFVDFDYEVSQVASRDQQGNIVFYPLVENKHRDGILRETIPLAQHHPLEAQAREIVTKLLVHFDYVGSFAVEFFVKGLDLYVNETAPRVHNSGHWSMSGCDVGQFENHMRAVMGLDVVEPTVLFSHHLMINLIGEAVDVNLFVDTETVYVKDYLKTVREGRKMGHINIHANDDNTFSKIVNSVYNKVKAKPCSVWK